MRHNKQNRLLSSHMFTQAYSNTLSDRYPEHLEPEAEPIHPVPKPRVSESVIHQSLQQQLGTDWPIH